MICFVTKYSLRGFTILSEDICNADANNGKSLFPFKFFEVYAFSRAIFSIPNILKQVNSPNSLFYQIVGL